MLRPIVRKAAENGFCLCSAQSHGRGIFDHLVILLLNELPVDRARQYPSHIGIGIWLPSLWTVQLLLIDVFQSWHELKTEQVTKPKGHFVLPMCIHKLFFHLHLGAVS